MLTANYFFTLSAVTVLWLNALRYACYDSSLSAVLLVRSVVYNLQFLRVVRQVLAFVLVLVGPVLINTTSESGENENDKLACVKKGQWKLRSWPNESGSWSRSPMDKADSDGKQKILSRAHTSAKVIRLNGTMHCGYFPDSFQPGKTAAPVSFCGLV